MQNYYSDSVIGVGKEWNKSLLGTNALLQLSMLKDYNQNKELFANEFLNQDS